jgi:uncharacterized protein (DUF2267 family)
MASRKQLVRMLARASAVLGVVALVRRAAPRLRQHCPRCRQVSSVPDPNVDDLTLGDRVRSTLGPLEKRLDVPHVHVLVEDHIVLLHGEVAHESDAVAIEDAVLGISGVHGIESYLHIGLVAGDTRPSEGAGHGAPSPALDALLAAARSGGAGKHAAAAVRATLAVLAERLPDGEREHVLAHLPADVRALFRAPRRRRREHPIRSASELVAAVVTEGHEVATDRADAIVESVIGRFRTLVPDEAADIAAVLPHDLRQLWLGAVPG